MFSTSAATASRPSWLINSFAIALVLLSSASLLWIIRDGPPSRTEVAGLLAVLTLTPVLLRWQAGWLMIFLLLPWVAWVRRLALYFDPTAVSVEAFDLTLLLPDFVVALTIAGFVLTRHLRRRELPDPLERPLIVALGLFAGLCALEIFNPFMASVAAGLNGWRVFLLYIGLYWVTRAVCQASAAAYAWVIVSLSFGALTALYGSYQYLVGFPAHEILWSKSNHAATQQIGDAMRAFSTFSFTSTFSHYMVVGALMSWAAMRLEGVGRLFRLLAPITLALCLVALAVTFVRSSFLGLILGGLTMLVVAGDPGWRLKRLVAVVAIGVGGMVLSPSSGGDAQAYDQPSGTGALVADRLLSMRDPSKVDTFNFRLRLWQQTIGGAVTNYPMGVGIGAGNAGRFGGNPFAAAFAYSESQVFSILAETGWPGLGLFLWITLYGLYFSLKTYDELEEPERKRLALMAIGLQAGLLASGITGGPVLYTLPGSAYYWTALGLVAAMRRAEQAERAAAAVRAAAPEAVSGIAP